MELPALDDRERTVTVVFAITVLALVARFVLLGDRVAHWDEARVGYWTLNYMQTGNYTYSPVLHGPFYHHINPILFSWFGITDATMRIAPALVTGLLPLATLLLRDRLRRLEITALALFLAVGPIFLYYSRFMRGDPLVGAFMFAGFAFLVRAIDTGRGRHIIGAALVIALGFTAKENALLYLLCWIGALVLVLDQRLLLAQYRDREWVSVLSNSIKHSARGIVRFASAIVVGIIAFFIIIVFFYAPRRNGVFYVPGSEGGTQATLGQLLVNPLLLLGVIEEATIGSVISFYEYWVTGGGAEPTPYLPYLTDLLATLGYGSAALCLFALVGFLANRYAADRPREIVLFAFAWGVASLVGYPIATDIKAPWAAVHVVLPLMIPAAVGVRVVVREGYDAIVAGLKTNDASVAARHWTSAGIVAVILLLAGAQIAVVGIYGVYLEPSSDGNKLVQYAQPAEDFHPEIHEVEQIAARNEGTDVVIYGPPLVQGDPIYNEPSCMGDEGWFNSLPLPWYLVRSNASVQCIPDQSALGSLEGSPPVIIAHADYTTVKRNGQNVTVPVVPSALEARFEGYDATIITMRTYGTEMVFLIDHDWMNQSKAISREKRRHRTTVREKKQHRTRQRERLNFQHRRGGV
jgi:uncharacterized protein (TIGR03663 family)